MSNLPQSPQDTPLRGDPDDVKSLTAAYEQLKTTDAGQPIAVAIRERGTTVKFGAADRAAIAQFDPKANEITIHHIQRAASPAVLAAHLAHEGTHAGWDRPLRLSSLEAFAEDYIEEEYQAFKAQAEVWRAVKGEASDEQCDWVSAMIAKGEADAKADIRELYATDIVRSWLRLAQREH